VLVPALGGDCDVRALAEGRARIEPPGSPIVQNQVVGSVWRGGAASTDRLRIDAEQEHHAAGSLTVGNSVLERELESRAQLGPVDHHVGVRGPYLRRKE